MSDTNVTRYTFVIHVSDKAADFTDRFLKTTGAATFIRKGAGITSIRAEWTRMPMSGGTVQRSLVSLARTLLLLSLQAQNVTLNCEMIEDISD